MKKYAERREAKKNTTEQLKEGLKSSILGPQNLGSGGARAPRVPPGSASGYCMINQELSAVTCLKTFRLLKL